MWGQKRIWIVTILIIAALSAGCSGLEVAPAVTPTTAAITVETGSVPATPTTSALAATVSRTATEAATPDVPSATPNELPPLDFSLSESGPWLVSFAGDGGIWADSLWASNQDGTALARLVEGRILVPRDIGAAASPVGGMIAFITADDPQLRGLKLNLLHLPEGRRTVVTPLSSPDTEAAPDTDPAMRPPEPLIAITEGTSYSWSPDGRRLAFMAAFEGPSSDLYVYSLEQSTISRLTDGPGEGIRPSWSPDGNEIVHFGVETLGTGAGATMIGAWSAKADGSGVTALYDPSASIEETVVGWTKNDTFAVHSANQDQGTMNLRTVNVQTLNTTVLWEAPFRDVALDPRDGTLLLAAGPESGDPQGLYHLAPDGSARWRVVEDLAHTVVWSDEASLFLVETEHGVLAVSSQGDFIDLVVPDATSGLPAVAPGSRALAWAGSALWIGSLLNSIDDPPSQLFGEPATAVTWSRDGSHLLFIAADGLFVAHAPDYAPQLVAGNPGRLWWVWVQP